MTSNGVDEKNRPSAGSFVVEAEPYPWPYDGRLMPSNTALVIIDMQTDFCGKGGYVDMMGYDLSNTRRAVEPIKALLSLCREHGYHVIHTREGHKADLSDLPANKRWRSRQIGAGIGDGGPKGRILVRGEEGWDIIPELYPLPGEAIIDKPGKGSFYATDFDMVLKTRQIRNLIITGITTDVCVSTTMREANDRGYECVVLTDCTGATDMKNHEATFSMVKMQYGVFGAVSDSQKVAAALKQAAARAKGEQFSIKDLSGRWHSTDFYPAEDTTVKFQQEQDIVVTEEAVVATKFTDGGDPFVKAGNTTWFFDLPRDPDTVPNAGGSVAADSKPKKLLTFSYGAAFYGQLRGGGRSGDAKDFFWQPARITVVDPDTIEVYLVKKNYTGHFHRGGLRKRKRE
eukprot:gnl/MRDRNA2_/MRDRNA2_32051_c0_seq1.p1 gnl/MRDRNA2_/MRDRNA2_32051_c0~~gnl/MRDRNA2_/MRDRNA2_32051_c0_seq1.p1  ORF type:complete len:425 (+),score=80.35 gnl/MRDRNA2_/MRDRNA2_32051_c0_seq1:76-1275(+)